MKKITTLGVLAALGLVAGAWEAWTIINTEDGDTISATIRKLASRQPFIVLATGMLVGHLFWPLIDGQTDASE